MHEMLEQNFIYECHLDSVVCLGRWNFASKDILPFSRAEFSDIMRFGARNDTGGGKLIKVRFNLLTNTSEK